MGHVIYKYFKKDIDGVEYTKFKSMTADTRIETSIFKPTADLTIEEQAMIQAFIDEGGVVDLWKSGLDPGTPGVDTVMS